EPDNHSGNHTQGKQNGSCPTDITPQRTVRELPKQRLLNLIQKQPAVQTEHISHKFHDCSLIGAISQNGCCVWIDHVLYPALRPSTPSATTGTRTASLRFGSRNGPSPASP